MRPPRIRTITFIPYTRCIYPPRFGQYWTLLCFASSSALNMPCMHFLFVGPGVCVRRPSDSTSRWTPLSFANSSCCQVCNGLSPSSYRPCRAYKKSSKAKCFGALNKSIFVRLASVEFDNTHNVDINRNFFQFRNANQSNFEFFQINFQVTGSSRIALLGRFRDRR